MNADARPLIAGGGWQNTSFNLTEEAFQFILCMIEQVIGAFDFRHVPISLSLYKERLSLFFNQPTDRPTNKPTLRRWETDLSVARTIMNVASTFHRTFNGATQFVQQMITTYDIWRDPMFWEKFFWGARRSL